jgi:hypothetical protein
MDLDKIHWILILVIVALMIIMIMRRNKYMHRNMLSKQLVDLWVSHLFYTQMVVVAFFSDNGDVASGAENEVSLLDANKRRLIQNQYDIGKFFTMVFGEAVGKQVTTLLLEHIMTAVNVLKAIKDKNTANQKKELDAFYLNANTIGEALDKLYGTDKTFQIHMKHHIDYLVESITNYVGGNYTAYINANDKYMAAGLHMAYSMSNV